MSRTYRHKLPLLDNNNQFNIEVQRGLHSEKLPLRDPDIDYSEAGGIKGKREAKRRMAKKHRQNSRLILKEQIRYLGNN